MAQRLVSWETGPIPDVLDKLLRDMTTDRNILFMTDGYRFDPSEEMTPEKVRKADVRTRTEKAIQAQAARTKAKAEVFTPAWLVNHMNNKCDEDWFGRPDVFNTEWEKDGVHGWTGRSITVQFDGRGWDDYVQSTRLEITCGEAPFITTRYDAVTGERLDIGKRVGVLDRKLKIVHQNTKSMTASEKAQYVVEAVKACYGYEYQGDSLLLARCNVLMTVLDYWQSSKYFASDPGILPMDELCDVICWNFWQMDGREKTVPGTDIRCMVRDWATGETLFFDECSVAGNGIGDKAAVADALAAAEAARQASGFRHFDDIGDPDQADGAFEPVGQDRIVASSVGLLANSIPRSTISDDLYAQGAKLMYQLACQYYGTAQGMQMILDRMASEPVNPEAGAGFAGMVGRFCIKGRMTGAMRSSLSEFRDEAYDPILKLCRDGVELLLRSVLYYQKHPDVDVINSSDLEKLARAVDWDGLPDGWDGRVMGFVAEMVEHDGHGTDFRVSRVLPEDGARADQKGVNLTAAIQDAGRLFGICRKYLFGRMA